jgi:hypothetical protein
MNEPTSAPAREQVDADGVAVLYEAAGIAPGTSIQDAATQLAALVADNERLADEAVDAVTRQAQLLGMTVEQGAMQLAVVPPREIVIQWVLAARHMLGPAENYTETPIELPASVELEIGAAGEPERYLVTVQRVGKLSPHQARRRAEDERDQLRVALREWADKQDQAAAELLAEPPDTSTDQALAVREAVAATCFAVAGRLRCLADQDRTRPAASGGGSGA